MIRTITLLLFLTTSLMYSNAKIIVTGKILQKETLTPLEYATVSFTETKQSNPKYSGITDKNATLSIEIEKGTYTIRIEFTGFNSFFLENKRVDLDLGMLYLSQDVQLLIKGVVRGKKRLLESKLAIRFITLVET